MHAPSEWMIYGATGYTGRLIAAEAVHRGHQPILAGRTAASVEPLAVSLGCESRVFTLEPAEAVAPHLAGCVAVLNTAGPFSATAAPLIEACLAAGVHYLDITGEIDCLEAAAARNQQAIERGVCLIPAVGFDVVPTDCLAATLAHGLPDATHLQLAFRGMKTISPGTAKTLLENLPHGGRARINGKIVRVPLAWKTMRAPFREGRRWAMTIPWGDVATAYYSTGIPNIEVYAGMPRSRIRLIRLARGLLPLLRFSPLAAVLRWLISRRVTGPTAEERQQEQASLWGRVQNAAGRSVEATLQTPSGYALTVLSALAAIESVLHSPPPPGFHTPSTAFGQHFVEQLPGVSLQTSAAASESRG